MALNVGPDFKQRWLNVPEAVRQTFIDDLGRICDVLQPENNIEQWLEKDQKQQALSFERIEAAYAERKAQLIEEARIRKQQALEQALAKKRAAQQAYAEQLKQDELRQFAEQAQTLALIRHSIDRDTLTYTSRYHKNPESTPFNFAKGLSVPEHEMLSELESVRIRLELEAETQIEQAVSAFRAKLQAAAQEEIEYVLKNSSFSEEQPKN
ncbi:cell division protein BlhA [Acinetobacter pragensis]|uniref:cell division protein BlhA n=1 Tax=Acinetobacter pragensis TaxID=1806892 RepID=UPI00333E6F7B